MGWAGRAANNGIFRVFRLFPSSILGAKKKGEKKEKILFRTRSVLFAKPKEKERGAKTLDSKAEPNEGRLRVWGLISGGEGRI